MNETHAFADNRVQVSQDQEAWRGERIYCNPPYGPAIPAWLSRAREAVVAVYLLPARTDTAWWHEYVMGAKEIRFIRTVALLVATGILMALSVMPVVIEVQAISFHAEGAGEERDERFG